MRYDEQEEIIQTAAPQEAVPMNAAVDATESATEDLNLHGDSPVDKLQSAVYQAGMRMLPILNAEVSSEKQETGTPLETLNTVLKELGHFSYNVGFAGEQSCGKSTVINSLLQYPLMPTCQATTTASVVQVVYSDHFRVRAIDDDTKKIVLDYDCEMPKNPAAQKQFRERFEKLLDYAISAMGTLVIENFQYYTSVSVADKRITANDIDMTPEDPKHVMLLLFILLAVYVGQNSPEWTEAKRQLMEKRSALLVYFGIPKDTINLSVRSQGQFDMLKSGLVITDLPGLGSNAVHQERADGRKVKGHNEITKEAIQQTDSMVFLTTPENREAGYKALPEMLSSAKLKETVCKGDRIIPVLNKADTCGKQQKRTAIQAFVAALAAANVVKKPEDIRLYSGILGEYNFKGIPFERMLFVQDNFNERSVRREAEHKHIDYAALKEEKLSYLKEDMKDLYAESGIEELLQFFRTSYIEVGKYNKSTAALQAMRAMVISVVSGLSTAVKLCENRLMSQTTVQESLMRSLEDAVTNPLAKATERRNEEVQRISADSHDDFASSEEIIKKVYITAFEKALQAYKEKLLKTLNKFKLGALGFSDKARIDIAGDANRQYYLTLLSELYDFPVSLMDVNKQYEAILKKIRVSIDRLYADSLRDLGNLKEDVSRSLDRTIALAKSNISEKEFETLEEVREQLLILVEQQIDIVTINMAQQQQHETNTANDILSAIFNLNKDMTNAYSAAIKKQLYDKQSKGFLFKSREYLLVDGADGMKQAVRNLQLSEEDSRNLALNLEANVDSIFYSQIPNWVDSLRSIVVMYGELEKRLREPLQNIIDVMTGSLDGLSQKMAESKAQIMRWYTTCNAFNVELHPYLDAARVYMQDREDSNLWLLENIFYKCFSKEVEEEYERVRNAQ